jgi:hypothetical protein
VSGTATHPLTDTQAKAIYNAIKAALRIVPTSPTLVQPGAPITAALVPAAPELDVSDLANGVLNLAMATKDVLFSSADPVDLPEQGDLDGDTVAANLVDVFGGQPFPPALPVANGSVAHPPGTIAQLFGTFALPQLKVRLEVAWKLRDSSGSDLQEGEDFLAPQGLASPGVSLLVPPPLTTELRLDTLANRTQGARVVCLWAHVTLQLGPHATLPFGPHAPFEFDVGGIPLVVLPLPIPTVVVLCSEPNFDVSHDAATLIVVPAHSPFSSAEPLFDALKRIESVMDALRDIGGVASFLLGLGPLLGAIPEEPRIRFAASDGVKEFSQITIKRRPWYDFLGSDPSFDDLPRSVLVVGVPGTRVEFFIDTFFKTDQGMFGLEVGPELVVAIRSLADLDPTVQPDTFPPQHVYEFALPVAWNRLSSLRFDGDWLGNVVMPHPVPELVCTPPLRKRPPPAKQ